MYARMPLAVREFAVVQIALNNGSSEVWKVQPSDFYFETADGRVLRGVPENTVIYNLFRRAGTDDVIKLQSAYEKAIYGNQHIRSNNGYEQRRQYAMAMGPAGLKAAAAASAIAFVANRPESQAIPPTARYFSPTRENNSAPGALWRVLAKRSMYSAPKVRWNPSRRELRLLPNEGAPSERTRRRNNQNQPTTEASNHTQSRKRELALSVGGNEAALAGAVKLANTQRRLMPAARSCTPEILKRRPPRR